MVKKRFYLVKDKIENYISYIDENNFKEIKKIRHLKNIYKIKNENIGNDSFSIINCFELVPIRATLTFSSFNFE